MSFFSRGKAVVRILDKRGLANTWRIGQTFPVRDENVHMLELDGPEHEHVKKYTPYEDKTLTGLAAFTVAAFLTINRGLPIKQGK